VNKQASERGDSQSLTPKLTQKKFPWIIFGLCLLFIGPLLLAQMLYLFRDTVPLKIKLSGQLFNPPILANSLGFIQDQSVKGKWQIIYCANQKDSVEWENQHDLLKRIHLALGKDQSRVILSSYHNSNHNSNHNFNHKLNHEFKRNSYQNNNQQNSPDNLDNPSNPSNPKNHGNQVLLIDPRGFIILFYPLPMQNPKGLLEDVRRLLRYSHVG
jgi:hypothetical protein